MKEIFPWDTEIPKEKAALWWLGQAGYYIKSDTSVIIDPYLSDSGGKAAPLFTRSYPPPADASLIRADIFIVTHDHLDHLDPETIEAYSYKSQTIFIAPRFAAKKLLKLGILPKNIHVVDQGDTIEIQRTQIKGIYAHPTGKEVLDTTGFLITFSNGKSIYHCSDTSFCDLLLSSCPKADVLLTCINGKFGNLNIAQAVELTKAVKPFYVIPNHYDVMALNSEHPESFRYFCDCEKVESQCVVLKPLEEFIW